MSEPVSDRERSETVEDDRTAFVHIGDALHRANVGGLHNEGFCRACSDVYCALMDSEPLALLAVTPLSSLVVLHDREFVARCDSPAHDNDRMAIGPYCLTSDHASFVRSASGPERSTLSDAERAVVAAALDWHAWAVAHPDIPEGNADQDTVLFRVVSDYRRFLLDEHARPVASGPERTT